MVLTFLFWALPGGLGLLLVLAVFRTRSMAAQAPKLVPLVGQVHRLRDGAIHYLDLGPKDAQPLVLIHGLSGQLQHFDYGLTDLLKDEFRVIAVDRPGCGYSERADDALADPSEQARMIGELLDALGIERPVLVGHSLGGAVALAMALDRPDKTGALALLCPVTQDQSGVPEVFKGLQVRSPWMRRLLGHTIAVPLAAATKDKVLSIVFHPEPWPQDFMTRGGAALGLRPKAFVTAASDVVALQAAAARISARYDHDLTVPGGVLFGAADAILSPTAHGHTMQVHGLSCETLADRGHMIPITAPADCADFIRRMAARVT
ncbi:alpha/beta fold hydrolase [Sedimentitalea sp. HM32M-2]|uniref:alpha/beta fold hydrolase n=1 Tax=Sedimentitalea sp. HM32M-2 TaxID=3351566 RepID=UPI00362B9BD8